MREFRALGQASWDTQAGAQRQAKTCSCLTVPVLPRTRNSSEDAPGELPAIRDLKKLEFA